MYLKGDDLCGNGGADIRPQDDPDGLIERHEACIDKADRHDRGGAAALNDGGDSDPYKDRHYPIVGKGLQDSPHSVASGLLEPLGHKPHPDEKEANSSDEAEYQLLGFHRYFATFLGDQQIVILLIHLLVFDRHYYMDSLRKGQAGCPGEFIAEGGFHL